MNIGELIYRFENTSGTVKDFNSIFKDCPLKWRNLEAEVEIGEPVGPDNTRELNIEGIAVKHVFSTPQSEEIEKAVIERKNHISLGTYALNDDNENEVISTREANLGMAQYTLLQYLRGGQSPYYTITQISKFFNLTTKSVRKHLQDMESKGIIKMEATSLNERRSIIISEDWL